MTLIKAHFDNYEYVNTHGIQFKYMMLLASNCMFCKQMIKVENIEHMSTDRLHITNNKKINNGWHWPAFYKNKKIVSILENDKIELAGSHHEGCMLSYDLAKKINNYLRVNNIFNLVERELCFEEILLASLEKYFQGDVGYRYCRIFWGNPDIMANLSDIINIRKSNENLCIVKRVPRIIDSGIRHFLFRIDDNTDNIINDNGYILNKNNYKNNIIITDLTGNSNIILSDNIIEFRKNFSNTHIFMWFGYMVNETKIYNLNFDIMIDTPIKNINNIGLKTHNPTHIYNDFLNNIIPNVWKNVNINVNAKKDTLLILIFDDVDTKLCVKTRNFKLL